TPTPTPSPTPAPTPSMGSQMSGGGGAMDVVLLVALLLVATLKHITGVALTCRACTRESSARPAQNRLSAYEGDILFQQQQHGSIAYRGGGFVGIGERYAFGQALVEAKLPFQDLID